ncbi:MAG TPA: hypothetical protein HPP90_06225 [Deltaproteobacteria bacterium]|nr:hypothetical protein [Deltaproteobacteria bacterium]
MKRLLVVILGWMVVSAGVSYAGLNDNGDGTVTDTSTGLTWQQETTGPVTWEEALAY